MDPMKVLRPFPRIQPLKHENHIWWATSETWIYKMDLDILVDVAVRVKKPRKARCAFHLCGGRSSVRQNCKRWYGIKNLEEMVNFTGRVPDRDLLETLSTADVCVNPISPVK